MGLRRLNEEAPVARRARLAAAYERPATDLAATASSSTSSSSSTTNNSAKQGNERLFRCHSQATNKRRPLRLPTADFAAFQRKLTAEFGTSEVQFVLGGMPVDITNADDLQLALAECPQGDLIELSILDGPPAPAALTPSPGLTSGR
ncbi:uncharacterized protein ACA1_299270, partial [Acanthamoeba castellanii str. Neff]